MSSRRLAVVVNPTKFDDLDEVRRRITAVCTENGWAEPLWLETTEEDPGLGQAADAVDQGAEIVCALGGDGTVRAVATSLVGTDVPLGLLPAGTGNLLARNLGLPISSIEDSLEVVLTGRTRRIDVGLVRLLPDPVSPGALRGDKESEEDPTDPRQKDEEVFLVMTGIGMDAEVMANTDEKVKGVLGWPAYVVAGVLRLWKRGFRVRLAGSGSRAKGRHARSVVVGNCGTLQGNFELMPDAELDDGRLDVVVMSPTGVFGWLAVLLALVTRNARGHRSVTRMSGTTFAVATGERVEAQIDGEPMGAQYGMRVRVLPGALGVRSGQG